MDGLGFCPDLIECGRHVQSEADRAVDVLVLRPWTARSSAARHTARQLGGRRRGGAGPEALGRETIFWHDLPDHGPGDRRFVDDEDDDDDTDDDEWFDQFEDDWCEEPWMRWMDELE